MPAITRQALFIYGHPSARCTDSPPMSPGCDADLNGDNVVDILDLLLLLGEWT